MQLVSHRFEGSKPVLKFSSLLILSVAVPNILYNTHFIIIFTPYNM